MELSSIGDQVFAVESITKKRVRKVRLRLRVTLSASCRLPQLMSVRDDPPRERWSSRILVRRPHGASKLGYAVSQLGH